MRILRINIDVLFLGCNFPSDVTKFNVIQHSLLALNGWEKKNVMHRPHVACTRLLPTSHRPDA